MPIDPTLLSSFVLAAVVLAVSPGPDLVLISTYSSTKGLRSGLLIAVGILLAGLIQTALVAFGLGQLMAAAPAVATGVRMVGAAYLAAIGVGMLRDWYRQRGLPADEEPAIAPETTDRRLIVRGLGNNLLNPKALIFFSVFLPQFTVNGPSIALQIVVLGVVLSLIAFAVNSIVAFSFSRIAHSLGNRIQSSGRTVEGILGALFVGLAVRLAANR